MPVQYNTFTDCQNLRVLNIVNMVAKLVVITS